MYSGHDAKAGETRSLRSDELLIGWGNFADDKGGENQWQILRKALYIRFIPNHFRDTNGDGLGDLRGVTAKLDYIKEAGGRLYLDDAVFRITSEG